MLIMLLLVEFFFFFTTNLFPDVRGTKCIHCWTKLHWLLFTAKSTPRSTNITSPDFNQSTGWSVWGRLDSDSGPHWFRVQFSIDEREWPKAGVPQLASRLTGGGPSSVWGSMAHLKGHHCCVFQGKTCHLDKILCRSSKGGLKKKKKKRKSTALFIFANHLLSHMLFSFHFTTGYHLVLFFHIKVK